MDSSKPLNTNLKSENLYGVTIDKLRRRIQNRESKIGIIGLGYVGLPLSIRFSEEGFKTVGFDIDEEKVNLLNSGGLREKLRLFVSHTISVVMSRKKNLKC